MGVDLYFWGVALNLYLGFSLVSMGFFFSSLVYTVVGFFVVSTLGLSFTWRFLGSLFSGF